MKNFNTSTALLAICLSANSLFAQTAPAAITPKILGASFSINYARAYNNAAPAEGNALSLQFRIPIFSKFSLSAGTAFSKVKTIEYYYRTDFYSVLNHLDLSFSVGKRHRLVTAAGISHQFLPVNIDPDIIGFDCCFGPCPTIYSAESRNNYLGANLMLDYQFHFSKKIFAGVGAEQHFFKRSKNELSYGYFPRKIPVRQLRLGIGFKI